MGCFVIERFPGGRWLSFFHHVINVLVRYVLKTAAFGKVLPDQAVGVFVQAALP